LPERHHEKFRRKVDSINQEIERLESTREGSNSLAQLLRRPEISYADLPQRNQALAKEVVEQVEIAIKYAGYVARQEVEVEKYKSFENKEIPAWFDYNVVPGLRTEARQKLLKMRPLTIGQASRISGISPADISLVMVWMKRGPGGSQKAATLVATH